MSSATIPRHVLSKSTFVRGCQCTKSLWLNKNGSDLRDQLSNAQQSIFTQGTSVGQLARDLFPGGVDASPCDSFHFQQSVLDTLRYIADGHKIIYEAAFQFDGVFAAMDILVNNRGKWYAYEVKSSTSVKDPFVRDAALQYHVITNSGIELSDICIIYINNEYQKNGALELQNLFSRESVLKDVLVLQPFIQQKITEFKNVLTKKAAPSYDIGAHCSDPYGCDFTGYCWKHIPEDSVFDLRGRGGWDTAFDLYLKGILKIEDIPSSYPIGNSQKVQVEVHKKKDLHINIAELRAFLKNLKYPLYFVDFETYNNAIPEHDGCWPYQQIPFQFSLHIVAGDEPEHFEKENVEHICFLAEHGKDPREEFLKTLVENLGSKGSIIVYNIGFESGRLNDLAKSFPKYSKKIASIKERMVDLMAPFRSKHYYSAAMKGSYSIKEVLPVLVPGLSYANLPINNGATASEAFCQLKHETDKDKIRIVREQLLQYCEMDTWAMVKILEKLINTQ